MHKILDKIMRPPGKRLLISAEDRTASERMRNKSANKKVFLLSIVLLIIIDQLTKYIIRYLGGFYICNSGMAFGIKTTPLFFYSLWIIIILIILNLLITKYPAYRYPLAIILSGAFSNLLDRLNYGCVIDFIDLKIWPVFNLADIFICLGVLLFVMRFKFTSHQASPQ